MFCGALQLAGTDPDGEPVLRQTGMIQLELNAEGKVFYQLPKGEWVVAHISARPLQWFSDYGDPYIDLLNPDAAQAFVEATHRKYEKELGSLLSRFVAILP